jgi:hypothetical protein
MTVRSSMSDLITRTRLMVADPAGPTQLFDSQAIQDTLDACREDVQYEALEPRPTLSPSGITYTDYWSPRGWWESDAVLIGISYATLTPATSDYVVGHWTFSNQYPPALIKGKRYDVYRAAADLLELKLASLAATTYDFSANGQSFHRSTIIATLETRIANYRRKQWVRTSQMQRADMAGSGRQGISDPDRQAQIAGPVSANVPFLTGN